jgi:RimJ/RimL family protein N-acetyltransferase
MDIVKVPIAEIRNYVEALARLIKSTVNLPDSAIQHFAKEWTDERMKSCISTWVFLMARDQGEIIGVLLGTPVEGGVGTIIWVLVDKSKQKQGIGGILFKEACEIYKDKGSHKVKLTVPDEQTTKFYIKLGMQLEGVHRNHWWHVDFWSMGIQLH